MYIETVLLLFIIKSVCLTLTLIFLKVISEVSKAKSEVCLKDLCPEDKRRIANLIEELARYPTLLSFMNLTIYSDGN